jgi:hypothetical protein
MAPAPADVLAAAVSGSPLQAEYGQELDRESAYERLQAKLAPPPAPAAPAPTPASPSAPAPAREPREERREEREGPSVITQAMESPVVRSFLRSAGSALGREITRSIFGTARRTSSRRR